MVIIIALILAWRGWYRGALRQIFEYTGGFMGLLLGAYLGPRLVREYTDRAGVEAALLSLVVVFITLSIGQIIGYVIGARFGEMAKRARMGKVDSSVGAVIGAVAAFVAYWLVGSVLVLGPSRAVANELSDSTVLRIANNVSRPPDLLRYLQQYLDTSGFPQVFVGIPPGDGEPVKPPSKKTARRAAAAAEDSTVRVVVPACGGTQLGSGWVAAEDTVVTNAHVVAGGDRVTVEQRETIDAGVTGTVVLFDDHLDLAVLRVPGLSAEPLPLLTRQLDRGAPGATLGFPGSRQGQLVPKPAAVQAVFEARGRDIYGRDEVQREVYELQSPVRQGDSGGPFVTPAGEVAGVVFAASTTDGGTGYALTGAEVEDEVRAGAARTRAVSTGECTH